LARLQAKQAQLKEYSVTRSKSFKDLVQHHVKTDKAFAEALLREGIDAMLSGDVETGKTILRDYIKATVGFEKLGQATAAPAKSLIRMFGARGNPQAKNLFKVIGYLQKRAGVRYSVVGRAVVKPRSRVVPIRGQLPDGETSKTPRPLEVTKFKETMRNSRR
jgi:hypothetical protein